MGTAKIKVITTGKERDIEAADGANLLHVLREDGVSIAANCGGRGTCGKCKVIIEGEKKLACQTEVTDGMCAEIVSGEESFAILADYGSDYGMAHFDGKLKHPCVAVDIGTTTVVLQLIDADSGQIARTRSFLNGQRQYGADVVSRIQHAGQGGLEALTHAIRSGLTSSLKALCEDAGIGCEALEYICIAGNTTMMYLLLGLSCESLGQFPFEPEFSRKERYSYAETFGGDDANCPVYLVPWTSAYVGGDITAGYLACRDKDETVLLIDMGTNGEMMLWSGDKTWCCSTAAGPAFEGGGITFGTGSIPGAISLLDLKDGKFTYETIDKASPVGICGSGVLDATACMLSGEFIDESGRMGGDFAKDGVVLAEGAAGKKILFTQKDVREVQLAKSAVRAGVEILISEAGLTIPQVDVVYLAGGFGQKLRLSSAVAIGLLPAELAQKTRPIGNTSLGGCAMVCRDLGLMEDAKALAERATEVLLSAHKDFQDFFMDYMSFEEL
ncbi:hypothetical protein FACS1894167_09110 [Synergistales bacterium]|nr:hypothetical protein FACS1894167_09110 [Synergistales bacterium]